MQAILNAAVHFLHGIIPLIHKEHTEGEYAFATILGSVIAMFLNLSFAAMLCIATMGNAIDNIFYIYRISGSRWREVEIDE